MNPRLLTAFILSLVLPYSVWAVIPLVTDDADTVEPRRLQLNAGWQFTRMASMRLHSVPVNAVVGLTPRGELGATFGYQWRDGTGTAPDQADASDITDLKLTSKWRLWQRSDDGFKLSARLDLNVPTASRHEGFGTGRVDVGGVLTATYGWGKRLAGWERRLRRQRRLA